MYEVLKSKLGEKETKAFVHLIDEKMDAKINARKHELATKEDISVLKDDIAALRLSTKEDMMKLKDELLRTFFVTSLGQLIAIVACVISLILVIAKK
jgi:hypothetical protein